MRFDVDVPAVDSGQEIVLPLDPAKIRPGSKVVDITFFPMGRDPQSRLYIKRVDLRKKQASASLNSWPRLTSHPGCQP